MLVKYDQVQRAPSIQIGSDWIGYENEQSLLEKANYIKSKCLGGFMIWVCECGINLESDRFVFILKFFYFERRSISTTTADSSVITENIRYLNYSIMRS